MNLITQCELVHRVYNREYFMAPNVLFTNIYLILSRETARKPLSTSLLAVAAHQYYIIYLFFLHLKVTCG